MLVHAVEGVAEFVGQGSAAVSGHVPGADFDGWVAGERVEVRICHSLYRSRQALRRPLSTGS